MGENVVDPKAVTIVSGLPRTGTSMMMRMLEAGGVPILADGIRKADEDNRYGYYEYEPVKQVKKDASWIRRAYGKAVKVIYLLLYDLPPEHRYRVIFMRRPLEEVVASQKVMLKRRGNEPQGGDDATMIRLFAGHLRKIEAWLREQDHFEVLYVDYKQLVTDPRSHVQPVNEFLGGRLDVEVMVGVVDPTQYRHRR